MTDWLRRKLTLRHQLSERSPVGLASPGQRAGRLFFAGEMIGELRLGQFAGDPQRRWVRNLRIEEQFRGRGLGRQAMLLAEDLARASGATSIGLNVFAHKVQARNLYSSLGYQEASIQMRKDLTSRPIERSPIRCNRVHFLWLEARKCFSAVATSSSTTLAAGATPLTSAVD